MIDVRALEECKRLVKLCLHQYTGSDEYQPSYLNI